VGAEVVVLIVLLFVLSIYSTARAQSTSFTYQGLLADGGTPTNGNYDLQFSLWNSLSGGGQVGSTQNLNTVAVSNGVFTINLDFGAGAFPGASRFLEIAVRPAGVGSFTTLTPRQPITSTPYAVRSLNAATADSVPASGVTAGSGNYIQNNTSPQASSNFNITGTGSASIFEATTQYNLSGVRFLAGSLPNENTFVGSLSGNANLTGNHNTFVGGFTGSNTTDGFNNAFFGSGTGFENTSGAANSFFGDSTGTRNTTGSENSFFGSFSGVFTSTGNNNSFFGSNAGRNNNAGNFNTFVGSNADVALLQSSGDRDTLLGANSRINTTATFNPRNASAIGANAQVDTSNSLVLGSINGVNGSLSDTDVGIGTTAPTARLSVVATGDGARVLHLGTERAWVFRQFGTGAAAALELTGDDANNNNKNFLINTQGFVGIGTTAPTANLSVNGSANKPGGGSWGTFSDNRLKNIRGTFLPGLQALMRLQPLRYEYKPNNALQLQSDGEHIGFSAQAVQKVIPEAVTKTDNGYLVVNNDPILWTMLNAIKEQQVQIQKQSEMIETQRLTFKRQQKEIAALKRTVANMRTRRR